MKCTKLASHQDAGEFHQLVVAGRNYLKPTECDIWRKQICQHPFFVAVVEQVVKQRQHSWRNVMEPNELENLLVSDFYANGGFESLLELSDLLFDEFVKKAIATVDNRARHLFLLELTPPKHRPKSKGVVHHLTGFDLTTVIDPTDRDESERRAELLGCLRKSILTVLSEAERHVFIRIVSCGDSQSEIALSFKWSRKRVRKYRQSGLRKLRRALDQIGW